jgi:chromatin segregation and condensation protein Rec8/ScpA/Scc1 (kleisin family)
MGGPSSGGSDTSDDRNQLTYSEQLDRDKKKKNLAQHEKNMRENRDGENNRIKSKKSEEQPKVKSQMDNTEIKSKEVDADKTAPTEVEVDQDDILLKNKKKGRNVTVLTSVTGVKDQPTLSKKYLLGD